MKAHELEAPGVCYICELAIADEYFDTERYNFSEWDTHMEGRKYICSNCIADICNAYDLVMRDDLAETSAFVARAKQELTALYESLQKGLEDVMTTYHNIDNKQPKKDIVRVRKQTAKRADDPVVSGAAVDGDASEASS